MIRILLVTTAFLLVFSSCDKFYEESAIPSFIRIDKVDFSAGTGHGSDSVVIHDVWVYVDGESIGAFEIPAVVPILKSGKHTIKLSFGVILNGISATRSINPFFASYTQTVDLIEDSVISMNPSSTYVSGSKFIWNDNGEEAFEDGGITLDSISGSSVNIIKSTSEVYEGAYSGLIHLTTDKYAFLATSTNSFKMPVYGNKSNLLELHIKNPNNAIGMGVFLTYSTGVVVRVPYLTINKGNNWKKIYINMSNLLDDYLTASSYKVFFSTTLESGNQSADIYLDNIKLITF